MRRHIALLIATFLLRICSGKVFNVHDDVFAYPQYEVEFSDEYVLDGEAKERLAFASSVSASKTKPAGADATNSDLQIRSSSSEKGADTALKDHASDPPDDHEYMILHSKPYLCSIPRVPSTKNETSSSNPEEEEKELMRAADRGWELLQEMEGHCMYFISGWWSYSFCYNKEIRQFHALPPGRGNVPMYPPIEDDQVPAFVLGMFPRPGQTAGSIEGRPQQKQPEGEGRGLQVSPVQTQGDMRYMVLKLAGGSVCDITGRARKIEVQFHCHPQSADRIGSIKETSTCSYVMLVYTPRLCNDVAFLPPRGTTVQKIVCREIVAESEVDEWHARKADEVEQKLLSAKSEGAPPRPVVGGIEVGGRKLFGDDPRFVEPPRVFDPLDIHTDVVAQWDPRENNGEVFQLDREELRHMDLSSSAVDGMVKKLKKMAKGKPWRLEIRENQVGARELIGIVDEEDEGEEPIDDLKDEL